METNKVPIFTLDLADLNWQFKPVRGKRRLKLYIKINKEETEKWEELRDTIKPPEMPDSEFCKILFYKGIESFMSELTERINKLSQEEKEAILNESVSEEPQTEDEKQKADTT